ncbi:CHAT domain-containing protein [Roseofilum casamattae]|uniref:CHAT domain-containing protein n=1 Tax=Roseofilum casamattae BLCC-M143 TaxID=3022442 RepID=A0ABT7C244_9CYAN|nr:CHAT domain-containing protein [Roseofilum casamattae]MDJ1185137.1 CHAT domain-containing protein [Roseofilum casamattae BLCC-M143]
MQDPVGKATTLNNLGLVYDSIGQLQQAINSYQQALLLSRALQDRGGTATSLHNLGEVYRRIGDWQQAIEYYQQALRLRQAVQDRRGEATTLINLGVVYHHIRQPQQAIKYYQQALPILQAVQDRKGEATTLSNIGVVYRDINQSEKTVEYWKKSLGILLSLRNNLKQENRKTFIETSFAPTTAVALTSLLIEKQQPKEAFTWINRVTTYELADYTRLLGAKVQNPQAQARINEYNQRWQQIENLRRQLQSDFSDDQLSRRISTLETENIKLAEDIAQQFPEVADIFETTPANIQQLQATIPEGTIVLQPVPLTNVWNTPNTLALFLLTRDSFEVVQISLDAEKFNQLVQRYPEELEEAEEGYLTTSRELYNILIRPIEDKLNAYNPEQLSIIATGQLRYIPFETLKDSESQQFLIQKYPINYLTRLSKTPPNAETASNSSRLLAFGNPVPRPPQNLAGAEAEVNAISKLFRNSQRYLHDDATLEEFKTQAPKFPFLHLATHGCFKPDGCGELEMKANTILFADTQWPIQDAALLGLTDTRLIVLSACETAREADVDGNSLSGVAYLFERAGAQAVMASLWQAEDEKTQQLMKDFYRYVAEGMTQGEALRQAKLNQIELKLSPHFWSPFILIGDAQSYPIETGILMTFTDIIRNSRTTWILGAISIASISLIGRFWLLKRAS